MSKYGEPAITSMEAEAVYRTGAVHRGFHPPGSGDLKECEACAHFVANRPPRGVFICLDASRIRSTNDVILFVQQIEDMFRYAGRICATKIDISALGVEE